MGGTLFALFVFVGAALTRTLNHRLYEPITRAMALDDDRSVTKLRWATLMRYYTPKAMYCFNLFGSIEISWMFCIQVSCVMLSP